MKKPTADHSVDRSLPKEELRKRNEIRKSLEMVKEEYMGIREEMMREAMKKAEEEKKRKKEMESKQQKTGDIRTL